MPRTTAWAALKPGFEAIVAKHPKLGQGQHRRAPRHARHGQPLHRGVPRRGGPRLGDAALRLARRRQPHRHLLHRARQGGDAPRTSSTCRTRTSPICPRGRSTSTTTSRRSSWAQNFARDQPRADDGRMRWRRCAASSPSRSRRIGGGELPPQLRRARAPLRRGRAGDAQGRGARGGGRRSASSRARWARSRSSCAARATRRASARARTARAARCRAPRRSGASRVADHVAATAGVECRKDADVIDETPTAYKDIDAVMAAQATWSRSCTRCGRWCA